MAGDYLGAKTISKFDMSCALAHPEIKMLIVPPQNYAAFQAFSVGCTPHDREPIDIQVADSMTSVALLAFPHWIASIPPSYYVDPDV